MSISRNDLLYTSLAVAISIMGVWVIANPNAQLGLYVFVGLLAVVLAIAIILRPTLGANILIIAVFTNISDNFTKQGYPSLLKPLVALVAVAILIRYAYSGEKIEGRSKTGWIEFFLFAYFLIYAATYMVAGDKDRAATAIIDFGKDIVIIYCIQFAVRRVWDWKQSVWVIMTVTAIICALGLYQALTHNYSQDFFSLSQIMQDKVFGDTTTPRFAGPIHAPNMWGQILVAVVPFVIYRIISARKRMGKAVGIVFLGVIGFSIFNTYSRGAYLALAIIILLVILELRLNPMLAFASAVVVLLAAFALPSDYIARFETLTSLNPSSQYGVYQDSSFRGRASEMLTGLQMFVKHPVLGVGAANYKVNYQKYAQLIGIETRAEERDAHSLYVQVIAESGILGFIAFVALLISLIRGLTRARNAVRDDPAFRTWTPWLSAMRLSIIAYLITATFLHDAYIRYFWILVAMAITAIQLTAQQLENYRPHRSSPGFYADEQSKYLRG